MELRVAMERCSSRSVVMGEGVKVAGLRRGISVVGSDASEVC